MKNNENTLFKAMEEYAITQDSNLITEDIYNQYVKYIQHISLSKGLLNFMPIDDKVSIVNDSMWKRIGGFDKDKASMGTFLGVIIESSFLMKIRKNKSMKEQINNDLSFDDIVIENGSYDNEISRHVFEGKDDELFDDLLNTEAITKALDEYIIKKGDRANKYLREMIIMGLQGYNQSEISRKYKISQSYASRILEGFKDYLRKNKKKYFGMED